MNILVEYIQDLAEEIYIDGYDPEEVDKAMVAAIKSMEDEILKEAYSILDTMEARK